MFDHLGAIQVPEWLIMALHDPKWHDQDSRAPVGANNFVFVSASSCANAAQTSWGGGGCCWDGGGQVGGGGGGGHVGVVGHQGGHQHVQGQGVESRVKAVVCDDNIVFGGCQGSD